jgi:hypothetical protein
MSKFLTGKDNELEIWEIYFMKELTVYNFNTDLLWEIPLFLPTLK